MITQMATRYLQRDPFGSLYVLPVADNPAGVAAAGQILVAGAATASGTVNCYIGGVRIQCIARTGDTNATVAAALIAAINANVDLGVTAAAGTPADSIALTAVHKGESGNDIDIRFDYLGSAGGERGVPGITFAVTPMALGAGNPDIANGLANLSSEPFDFIGLAYTDTANLDAIKDFLADDVGRWSWAQMLYGGAFAAYRGTLGECTTFGEGRNDQHVSVVAFNDSPDTSWIWATEAIAVCAASLRVDPGLPLQYIGTTLKAPPIASRWSIGERNTLLYSGLSTFRVGQDGTVIVERMTTTYQKNLAGAADDSYLDVETMYGLTFVARDLSDYLLTRYARKKLVSDTTPILAGSNCINAPMIKASVIMEYRALEAGGYVQNADAFAKAVVVENAGNGLVKILAPVDLVNQLRQIAILLQFRKS
jgi:phage tail sheath gpL-like